MSDIDPRFTETMFCVEATHYEATMLREKTGARYKWEQDSLGMMITVGELDGRPVNVSCCWNIIDGYRVLFWEPVSQVVDYEKIERWFDAHCSPMWDGDTRAAICNAMNFHLCLDAIDERKKAE